MSDTQTKDMTGRITIVTGATGGIGKAIARGLAKRDATVIIGARTQARGDAAKDEIIKDSGNQNVSVMIVDVSSKESIRTFVTEFEKKHEKLHVLVNNAGVWFTDRRESVDKHELTLGTNVLGPHLLTTLFGDLLKKSAPSRVVNIVSAFAGDYDPANLEYKTRKYDGFKAYNQSKQALRMLTFGTAKRFEGTGVTVNAAAPGFVKTDFNQNAKGFMATMINISSKLFAVSPEKGAETPIWAATSKEFEKATGKYLDAMKEKESKFREEAPIAELLKLCDAMTA